jgi:hypothetical protein
MPSRTIAPSTMHGARRMERIASRSPRFEVDLVNSVGA